LAKKLSNMFHISQKALENKVIILQTDLILKARKLDEYFWKCVNQEKYANITKGDNFIAKHFKDKKSILCTQRFGALGLNVVKSQYFKKVIYSDIFHENTGGNKYGRPQLF